MRASILATAAILAAALLATPATGEPSSRVVALMNEPMSMFDWGLHQLQTHTNERLNALLAGNSPIPSCRTIYVMESNTIEIWVIEHQHSFEDVRGAKAWCRDVVGAIRDALGVDPHTGALTTDTGRSLVCGFFIHRGWILDGETEALAAELDPLVDVLIDIGTTESPPWMLSCRADLVGYEVFFSE